MNGEIINEQGKSNDIYKGIGQTDEELHRK
jgi:hypothetical protein